MCKSLFSQIANDLNDIEFEITCIGDLSNMDAEKWLDVGTLIGRLEQIKRIDNNRLTVRADTLLDAINARIIGG